MRPADFRPRAHRLTVAVLGLLFASACSDGEPETASGDEAATPIAAVELQPRDLSRELAVSARVRPLAEIRLAARSGGTVEEVHVEIGDQVEADDLVVKLDVAEERAELARAEAHAEEARLDYERTTELRERDVASSADYERARAALRSAESERDLWQTRVDYGRVRASRDAVVTERFIEPGEAVDVGDTLLVLSATETLVLRPGVSERDVRHLTPGQTVPVHLDALPDEPLEARIRRIFPSADRETQRVAVEVALPEDAAAAGVRPGNLGRIGMMVDERPEALAVPAAAIGEDEQGRYVYVVEDEALTRRSVERGVTRGPWTEIVDGLEEGEVVLATNPLDMSAGERVRIVGWRG